MGWNTDVEPKRKGWYLCTVEDAGGRYVLPIFRNSYPNNKFCWEIKISGEIIAVCPFPEPYSGYSKKEIAEDINRIFGGDF